MDTSGNMTTIDMVYCKICDIYFAQSDYEEHKNECKMSRL